MSKKKTSGGRTKVAPELAKSQIVKAHLTPAEYNVINTRYKASGQKSMSKFVAKSLLAQPGDSIFNPVAFIASVDRIGADMGRIGNNINQIARHANALEKSGNVPTHLIAEFNKLMEEYLLSRQELITAYRAVMRKAGK